jgi:glyoxylase I family protein
MPQITGAVHHLNLSVTDLDRSASWYAQVFGLTARGRIEAADGLSSRVLLVHPSGFVLGLGVYLTNDGAAFTDEATGLDHVAFTVADEDELVAWLVRLDTLRVEHSEIIRAPGRSRIVMRDPDNIQLELYVPLRS